MALVLYLSHTFGIIYASYWSDSILLGVSFAVNLTVISHHYNNFQTKILNINSVGAEDVIFLIHAYMQYFDCEITIQ